MMFFNTLILLQHTCANAVLRTVNLSRHNDMESILQLRTAFKGIAETEKELLGMLDEQMKGCERNRRHPNSVMLGLCLRRLSLKYRRTLNQCRRHKCGCPSTSQSPICRTMLIQSPKSRVHGRQGETHVRRLHFSLQQSLLEERVAILGKLAPGGS